jgi:dehydrogenase/reductase SDR family member 1
MRLKGKVAVVTGASRGVGRGIAVALGAEGATVYLSGRTMEAAGERLGGSLRQTAEEIDARGGRGVPVRCDHGVDEDVQALFARVDSEQGRCDILVNNVFAIPSGEIFGTPFWKQPIDFWDTMHRVGLRSHYVASVYAAPLLLRSRGLIANISSFGGASYQVNVAYGVGKAGVDRLARDMARDLKPHGVCSVALYPGVVRTERVLAGELPFGTEASESPEFTGRAIAALFADPKRMDKTGRVHVVAELAEEYGFDDVDGTRPPSLRQPSREKKSAKETR